MRWREISGALACPRCRGPLEDRATDLRCGACGVAYGIEEDIPVLLAGDVPTRTYYEAVGVGGRRPPARFDLWEKVKARGSGHASNPAAPDIRSLADSVPWGIELGCGAGSARHYGLQDRLVGVDLSQSMLRQMRARNPGAAAIVADGGRLPFRSGAVPFLMTSDFLEHVLDPAAVLEEVARVLAPGGIAVHNDAWFVRPWARHGITLMSWGSATWRDRLLKALVAVREPLPVRAATVLPRRAWREIEASASGGAVALDWIALRPNYELFLLSDEDATASLDPHAVTLFYRSRGMIVVGAETLARRLTLRHRPVVVHKAED